VSFEDLIGRPAWSVPQAEKDRLILQGLNELTRHHAAACPAYTRILDAVWSGRRDAERLADVPFLPASLFKEIELASVPAAGMVLQSSGTSGQRPSRIVVDAESSALQSRSLVETMKPILGEVRVPMLVVDTRDVILNPQHMTARSAGVLGFMKFGAKTAFALNSGLQLDRDAIRTFLERNGQKPFLMFGFTFLVWAALYEGFADGEIDLSNGILIHSGGWKKLEDRKVSNASFRAALERRFALRKIFNFYGMVEQIGSIFLEASDGLLYAPNVADVIVRDEETWEPLPPGRPGIIQVVSLVPRSYPGHSILTEDRGEIVTVDHGTDGRMGKAIRILGRLPRAELRGCSDVIGERKKS
jgi:Acyl-protein synthetase, LuxE